MTGTLAVICTGAAGEARARSGGSGRTGIKTEFDVILKGMGPKRIQTIKAVRTFHGDLSLTEAKELVDSAPVKLLEAAPKEQGVGRQGASGAGRRR